MLIKTEKKEGLTATQLAVPKAILSKSPAWRYRSVRPATAWGLNNQGQPGPQNKLRTSLSQSKK